MTNQTSARRSFANSAELSAALLPTSADLAGPRPYSSTNADKPRKQADDSVERQSIPPRWLSQRAQYWPEESRSWHTSRSEQST